VYIIKEKEAVYDIKEEGAVYSKRRKEQCIT